MFRRLTESDHAPEPFATAQESKLIEALPGESYRSPQDNQDELLASETDQGLINDTDRMDIVHAPRRFHLMKTRRVDATKSSFGNLKHKAGVALFAEHRDDKLNDIDIDRGAQNLNRRRNKASTSSAARSMTLTSDVVLQRKNSDTTVPIEQEEDIAAIHQYVKDFESLNELESEICMDPNPDIVSSHNTINNDDDADYVYDTYIRHEAIKGSSTMDTMKSPVGAFGYLIISAEDEDFWNAFGEDESESEQDWDSEQDDENGKYTRTAVTDSNTDMAL